MPAVTVDEKAKFLRFLQIVNKDFDIETLEDRIELQKLVYLAKNYGLNFAYSFNWYYHGPYSTSLADLVYDINGDKDPNMLTRAKKIPTTALCKDEVQIQKFKEMVEPFVNDVTWLEAAGSLVWVRERHYAGIALEKCRDSLIKDLSFVYKQFDPSLVMDVLDRLQQYNMIN